MISVEFMPMATLFAIVTWTAVIVVGYNLFRIVAQYIKYENDLKFKDVKWNVIVISLLMGSYLVFNTGASGARITLDTQPNRAEMEQRFRTDEIIIETPPPRTETMPGFRPLGGELSEPLRN